MNPLCRFLHRTCALILCFLAFVPAVPSAAAFDKGDTTFYLPAVLNNASFGTVRPALLSPANGVVLNTLIPTFAWDMGQQEATSWGCLAFSTTPNPVSCRLSFLMGWWSSPPWSELMWYNLQPNTIYYWRVGVKLAGETSPSVWSDEWSFTSGPDGGPYPPAPALLSPANGSTVPYADLTLSWAPVGDGQGYDITVHDLSSGSWTSFTTSGPQAVLDAVFFLTPSTGYEWQVAAHNSYAWGPDSSPWTFTTGPAPAAPPQGEPGPGQPVILVDP